MKTVLAKLLEVLESRNAFVTYISIILLGLSYNSIPVEFTPNQIIDMFVGKNAGEILAVLLLNFFNPLSKMINKLIKKEWSWGFIKDSQNFITQLTTLLALIIGAFMDQMAAGIIVSILLQLWNLVTHLSKKPQNV